MSPGLVAIPPRVVNYNPQKNVGINRWVNRTRAFIRAMVTLPQPCIAPIIFVTSPGQGWFAVTGH